VKRLSLGILLFLLEVGIFTSLAQQKNEELSTLNLQAQCVVDSILSQNDGKFSGVVISVIDSVDPLSIENAFLRALNTRNIPAYLQKEAGEQSIRDSLLEIKIKALERRLVKSKERNFNGQIEKIAYEVQWRNLSTSRAGVLGTFEGISSSSVFPQASKTSSWLERYLIPAVVISSSALIVYLFFVVRK